MLGIQVVSEGVKRVVAVPAAPEEIVVGSAPGCQVVIADPAVDPRHLVLTSTPAGVRITDAGTRNGTRLNGLLMSQALLRPGDEVRVGSATLSLVEVSTAPAAAGPAARGMPAPAPKAAPPAAPAMPAPARASRKPRARKSIVSTASVRDRERVRRRGARPLVLIVGGVGAVLFLVLYMLHSASEGRKDDAREVYQKAFAQWEAGERDRAQAGFEAVLRDWMDTPTAPKAKEALDSMAAEIAREREAGGARAELEARWTQLELPEFEAEYRKLCSKYGGTPAADDEGFLPRLRERYRQEGKRRFEEARKLAAVLTAEGKYFDAVLVWHEYIYVPQNIPPDIVAATEEFRRIQTGATEAFAAVDREAQKLIDAERFEEATGLLRSRLGEFRGTRHAFALRQKLELVSLLLRGDTVEPEVAKRDVGRRQEYLKTADTAESLVQRRRYRDAVAVYLQAAGNCPYDDLVAEFRQRAEELEDYATLFTALREQVSSDPKRFRGVDLGHGLRANALAADEDTLTVSIRGARSRLSWSRMGPERLLGLLLRLRLDPGGRLALARFALEAGDEEAGHKAITAALKADETLRERGFLLLARARKISVPEGGFVLHRGRWLTPSERAEAELREEIADAERAARSSDDRKRDGGFARLRALGGPAGSALIAALTHQRQAHAEALKSLGVVRDPATKNAIADEIKRRRKEALALIFDQARYPYPHPVGPEYDAVQAEVDMLVDRVRVLWVGPIAWIIEKHADALGLYSSLESYSIELKALGSAPERSFADLVAEVNEKIGIQNFAGGGTSKKELEWNAKVLEYNRLVTIDADKEERACMDAVNEYRVMMGVKAVKWSGELLEAARAHCREMKDKSYFAHDCPFPGPEHDSHRKPSQRARQAGYGGGVSENIARGSKSGRGVFKQWYGSSGHHRNMLGSRHSELGVGRAGDFWTQNFGSVSKTVEVPRKAKKQN